MLAQTLIVTGALLFGLLAAGLEPDLHNIIAGTFVNKYRRVGEGAHGGADARKIIIFRFI